MGKYSWIKDGIIQIIFISFAVVFTVIIAQISISEQYTAYQEAKLEEKARNLARNAALMFSESGAVRNAEGMGVVLDVIFPKDVVGAEIISYALFSPGGNIAASTVGGEVFFPNEVLDENYFIQIEMPLIRAFAPVILDGITQYYLMIQLDDTPFLEFGGELSSNLYASLFRGILMMAIGFAIFTSISNLRKKKKPGEKPTPEEIAVQEAEARRNKKLLPKLPVQFASLAATARNRLRGNSNWSWTSSATSSSKSRTPRETRRFRIKSRSTTTSRACSAAATT